MRQPAAPGQVQLGDQTALGAQRDAVRRVLDVAAGHHAAVVDPGGGADPELRVRRVGVRHRLLGRRGQFLPGIVIP